MQLYHGRWFIFRNFEDLNATWCVVRDEVMSGRLGAIGASCSTLWYNPLGNGAGPCTTGRIAVYTNEEDYVEVGKRMIKLKVIQHDIQYKTLEATKGGEYSHVINSTRPISTKTIYWNKGRVFVSKSAKPPPPRGILPCPAKIRNRYQYNPETDLWKINIVNGLLSGPVHGKWIIKSNSDPKSEVNINELWHRLKGMIENKELPVIRMECPSKPNKESPPEIHITTTKAHMTAIGESLQDIVKYDIDYFISGSQEKNTLSWSEKQSKYNLQ